MRVSDLDLRYELNSLGVFQNCPQDTGVYTIESLEGDVLYLSYARNLTQSVTRHLPENELKNEIIARKGRFFRFFLTDDETYVGKIFDTYVSRKGRFPQGMTAAPLGSDWHGKPPPSPKQVDAAPAPAPALAPSDRSSGLEPLDLSLEPIEEKNSARNVLLVDDDVQLLVLMKELLEIDGHRVYAAANKKMLAKALEVNPIHVLILDYHLEDMTAIQVIENVKKAFPEVLIFLITGTQHKEEAYLLLKQGVKKIFPKPFSMKMLNRAVLEYFQKS
jgi:CheY-like chemotaxis protein